MDIKWKRYNGNTVMNGVVLSVIFTLVTILLLPALSALKNQEILSVSYLSDWEKYNIGRKYAFLLYCMLSLCMLFYILHRSNQMKQGKIGFQLEVAVLGVFFLCPFALEYGGLIAGEDWYAVWDIWISSDGYLKFACVQVAEGTFFLYLLTYLVFSCLSPIFRVGGKEYLKRYSMLGHFGYVMWKKYCEKKKEKKRKRQEKREEKNQRRTKKQRKKEEKKQEIEYLKTHLDFSPEAKRLINGVFYKIYGGLIVLIVIGIVFGNVTMWCWGVILLAAVAGGVSPWVNVQYLKIQKNYKDLQTAMYCIAQGREDEIPKDMGIFESFRPDLYQLESQYRAAIDEAVRSQRMRTELITNVSHDLKTPLTAITTYTELLKNPSLTTEEYISYIDTLERKCQRLRELIEDLFEISKANSNNVQIHKVDIDLVNLLKQVCIEHIEAYEQMDLQLRWKIPEEKVIVQLDSGKTYRVFENLFVNMQKYAMPHTRAYVDVVTLEERVDVIVKNISSEEITVQAEELTERFVRGDASRNTEGSGLGLAIAKSFVELQQGSFQVQIDGDLFKVMVSFPLREKKQIKEI